MVARWTCATLRSVRHELSIAAGDSPPVCVVVDTEASPQYTPAIWPVVPYWTFWYVPSNLLPRRFILAIITQDDDDDDDADVVAVVAGTGENGVGVEDD